MQPIQVEYFLQGTESEGNFLPTPNSCSYDQCITRTLPSKPIRYGFKLFTLAESKTEYISDFEVYTGKTSDAEQKQTKKVVK